MSALSLLKHYQRFLPKKIEKEQAPFIHRDLDFLKAIIQKPYQKKNIHLFVFFPDKFSMGGYEYFLETLEERQKAYLQEWLTDVLQTGKSFQTEVSTLEGDIIGLYGFVQGNCYLLLHLPLFRTQENIHDLRASYGKIYKNIEKLKDYCDLLPVMFWSRDDKQNFLFTNKAYEKLICEENEGEIFPKAKAHFLAQLALSKKTNQEIILPLISDGNIIEYRVYEMPFQDDNGGWYTLGYALNIEKEQKSERLIEELLRGRTEIVNLFPLPVVMFDERRMIIAYNQKFLALWDLTEADMDILPDHPSLLEKLQVKRLLPEYRDVKGWRTQQFKPYTQKDFIYNDKWHLPDGRILTVTSGACTGSGVVCFFEDMTQHLHIQKQHQNLVQNMRETLDSLELAVALFSSDGALKVFNKQFNHYCHEKLYVGVHLSYLSEFLKEYPAFAEFSALLLQKFRGIFTDETLSKTVNDGENYYDLKAVRLETGDVLLSFRNVSVQMNYQNILSQKADTLSELGHMREMFFRQISFQLREPMTAITGFSEVLEQKIFGDLNEKQEEYIGLLKMASKQMLGLIDNLLDLVSLDSAEIMQEQFTYNNLDNMVETIMTDLQTRLMDKSLKLKISKPSDLKIYGDYTSIRQTLLQLIYNAIEASPLEETITIKISNPQAGILCEIIDKGQGISDSVINFMSNSYLDKQDNLKLPMKGYGLYYIRRVCKIHNAELSFDVKHGTTVSILFKNKE